MVSQRSHHTVVISVSCRTGDSISLASVQVIHMTYDPRIRFIISSLVRLSYCGPNTLLLE
jgi:hypothetical protein